MDLEYFTSERFIHADLLKASQQVIDQAIQLWENGERPTAYAIAWPARTILTNSGVPLQGAVILELPTQVDRRQVLGQFVKRTSAYGLLVLEIEGKVLTALFESIHGTRSWKATVERHADRLVFGNQKTKDDVDTLNLLWSPNQGSS